MLVWSFSVHKRHAGLGDTKLMGFLGEHVEEQKSLGRSVVTWR